MFSVISKKKETLGNLIFELKRCCQPKTSKISKILVHSRSAFENSVASFQKVRLQVFLLFMGNLILNSSLTNLDISSMCFNSKRPLVSWNSTDFVGSCTFVLLR